ncbi:MAG: hypothetical protein IPL65_15390 [Lewinellaceae bacterium]|nr:hypothetical protein [Lewinellaceae bacterium]
MPTPEGYVILNAEEYAAVLRDKEVLESERMDWESEKQRLKDQIAELQRLLFGAQSERFVPTATPGQLLLEL